MVSGLGFFILAAKKLKESGQPEDFARTLKVNSQRVKGESDEA
jgi:hypothetical protein